MGYSTNEGISIICLPIKISIIDVALNSMGQLYNKVFLIDLNIYFQMLQIMLYSNNVFELVSMDCITRGTDSMGHTISESVSTSGKCNLSFYTMACYEM